MAETARFRSENPIDNSDPAMVSGSRDGEPFGSSL